ncbi:acetyl-CoA C-acyltransferase [Persicobacter sp. CCB-QB2]|uniref:acetyl-CoA C-acyltransferase n=1 Tax=Persicobacter sp. CCB-QB2 TaxID=1561025 RepID=UPI0006A991DC|nr:acetyl-CoA C-acyltransferase [Persicobacter sp. CCB-QB2]
MRDVFIVSVARSPMGSFMGKLSGFSATELGAHAVKSALDKLPQNAFQPDEIFMGNVVAANLGQAPAKQVAVKAGLGYEIPSTLINKVCSSGLKAVTLAAQSIMSGQNEIVVAGGMESMSNIPFYQPKARTGNKFGHVQLVDGLVQDGLFEPYYKFPMGNCAENTAREMNITRQMQDDYAVESYTRAKNATENGKFKAEIAPITIPQRKGEPIIMHEDEEFRNVKLDKIPHLKPVFDKEGTVTAANASTINDGAAALVLMSGEKVAELGLKPLAKIISFADASQDPLWFTTAPTKAIQKALEKADKQIEDIDFFEINEAFSAVAIANTQKLKLDYNKINVYGGAVALGHPLGCSGARILITLLSALRQETGNLGVAGICNGGGGATAIIIERQ